MQPAPAHRAPAITSFPTVCTHCGGRLGAFFWVTDYPRAAHAECVDWCARPFPFAWALPVLRTLYRAALPDERRVVAELGCTLRTLEAQWPSHAAHVVVLAAHVVDRARSLPVHRRGRPRL